MVGPPRRETVPHTSLRQALGQIVDNVENVRLAAWVGQKPAVVLDIQRQPGANIIETADRVKALLPQLGASLPQGIRLSVMSDRTQTVRASVEDRLIKRGGGE